MSTQIPNVDVPEGVMGKWKIERFIVTDADIQLHNLRCDFQPGMGGRKMKAGTYTRLLHGSDCVMSDTPAEKGDHFWPVHMARGVVLLNGLGLGMVANACLLKPEVEQVIVVERSPEVIALVAPHWTSRYGDRIKIEEADALEYQPPKGLRFGAAWHDIWTFICGDNLDQMKTLHRRYGRRSDWQGSWCRELCER